MTIFTGRPDSTFLRFGAAMALSQNEMNVDAWDGGLVLAPQAFTNMTEDQVEVSISDIQPQFTAPQLAGSIGAFIYGFSGSAASGPSPSFVGSNVGGS